MPILKTDTPTVSIITLLHGRRRFIPLLKLCVSEQTYPADKIEWVIFDDGPEDLGHVFTGPNELYVRTSKSLNIGRKRQFACDIASGEFLIFFDDDDLHFPHRVERTVNRLQKIGARMVAGNTEMLLADVSTEKVIKVGPHHKNHATAATMGFRKEFLKHTSFRLSDKSGEEMHFLKNWSVPVVQLKPNDTILALAHDENTVSKSHLFKGTEVQGTIDTYFENEKILSVLRSLWNA